MQRLVDNYQESHLANLTDEDLAALDLTDYIFQLRTVARERRPFSAKDGRLFGIGPWQTEPGDLLVLVLGAEVPYIFRRKAMGVPLELNGEAYVHAAMDGEVMANGYDVARILIQ